MAHNNQSTKNTLIYKNHREMQQNVLYLNSVGV